MKGLDYFKDVVVPFVQRRCDMTNLEGVTSAMLAVRGLMADVGITVHPRIIYCQGDPPGLTMPLPTSNVLHLEAVVQ